MEHIGIDYGSKMAGTTVIAYLEESRLHFAQSKKKKDADAFVKQWVTQHEPQMVFLDAPLSLPGVYTEPATYKDYFYRAGDRVLKAMSPMFLGGLTARAMQLSHALEQQHISVVETYPSRLADVLALDRKRYKKDKAYLPAAASTVLEQLNGIQLAEQPANCISWTPCLLFAADGATSKGSTSSTGKRLKVSLSYDKKSLVLAQQHRYNYGL